MALGSTQPLKEMRTTGISSGVKAAGARRLTTLQLHVPSDWKFGRLNLLEPSWPVQAFTGVALPL